MTPFRTALDRLAALAVAGVAHNYGVTAAPDALGRAQLPALLVLPGETRGGRLFGEHGDGFRALAFSGGPKTAAYLVTHLLLAAPAPPGDRLRARLPALAALMDAYMAALGADPTLGGALDEPARVTLEPGVFAHGGRRYHGCAFRHTWIIAY